MTVSIGLQTYLGAGFLGGMIWRRLLSHHHCKQMAGDEGSRGEETVRSYFFSLSMSLWLEWCHGPLTPGQVPDYTISLTTYIHLGKIVLPTRWRGGIVALPIHPSIHPSDRPSVCPSTYIHPSQAAKGALLHQRQYIHPIIVIIYAFL